MRPSAASGVVTDATQQARLAVFLDISQQVTGVGKLTALALVLSIEDPHRFARSRIVGAWLGLICRQVQSGQIDKKLGISKQGNEYLRSLMVSGAHYILGLFGPDCELHRHGERIAAGAGPNGKKRAVVAVARKLAVLLHRLWVSGETYMPLGYRNELQLKKAA